MISVTQNNERTEIEIDDSKGAHLAAEAMVIVRAMYDHLTECNKIEAMLYKELLIRLVSDGTIFDEELKGEEI